MNICYRCHQPITHGSTTSLGELGYYHIGTEINTGPYSSHLGCPTEDQIIANLEMAIKQGFKPEFCRTHEIHHKGIGNNDMV